MNAHRCRRDFHSAALSLQMQLQQSADLARLAGREFARRDRGEQRRAGGNSVLRARQGRKLDHHRPFAQGRQDAIQAQAQRRGIARQRQLDGLASQRLTLAVEQRLDCLCGLVAGSLGAAWVAGRERPAPRYRRVITRLVIHGSLHRARARRSPVGAARAAARRRGCIDVPARLATSLGGSDVALRGYRSPVRRRSDDREHDHERQRRSRDLTSQHHLGRVQECIGARRGSLGRSQDAPHLAIGAELALDGLDQPQHAGVRPECRQRQPGR